MSELDDLAEAARSTRRYRPPARPSNAGAVIGAIVFLVVAAIAIPYLFRGVEGHFATHPTPEQARATATILPVSAVELMSDYEQNGIAADQTYKGKSIAVIGNVKSIDRDILGKPFVCIDAGRMLTSIQCVLREDQASRAAALKPGDHVKITGVCDGKLVNVLLKECTLALTRAAAKLRFSQLRSRPEQDD